MWGKNIQISMGFLLLIAWFGLVNGWTLLLVVLSAAALHELGHCLILLAAGAKIRKLRIGICGAVLETDTQYLSYGWELAAILAGPGMNLLCALTFSTFEDSYWLVATGVHMVLCIFNLLPLRPLDGGRALYLVTAWLFGPDCGDVLTRIVGVTVGTTLTAGLLWVMWRSGGSLWLLPAAGGIMAASAHECCRKGDFL